MTHAHVVAARNIKNVVAVGLNSEIRIRHRQ